MKFSRIFFAMVAVAGCVAIASSVQAATPTLTVSRSGSGDGVQIEVTGDPNVSVIFYYTKLGVGFQITSLGNTNSNGYFSTIVSSGTYGIPSESSVYVSLNGLNGPKSPQVLWPLITDTTISTLSLSQGGVVLSVGQSATISAGSNSLYLSNNSNPPIANVSISGSQITITGNSQGSTIATICKLGSASNCASVYVAVQSTGSQSLTFSQNNVSIVAGQSVPVTVSGGSGLYVILTNSNAGYVQASLSGSVVTVTTSKTSGSSSIIVCSTDMYSCGVVNVAVVDASAAPITFSRSSLTVGVGQSTNISIYGATGSVFYVSSNSNPSIVQANLSGSTLTLVGNANGSSTVKICSSVGTCGTIAVTVEYQSGGGVLSLSQNAVSVVTGQTVAVVISGGAAPYSIVANSPTIFQATLSGNILSVYGVGAGSATADVCSAEGGCVVLTVTVNGATAAGNPILSQSSLSMTSGQGTTISITGSGSYYVASNSAPGAALVAISGNIVVVSALANGTTSASICQQIGQCATLTITVANPTVNPTVSVSISSQTVRVGSSATFMASALGFTNPVYAVTDSFLGTSVTTGNMNSTGVFTWTPSAGDVGTHSITVSVSDPAGKSASAVAQIVVTAPSVVSTPVVQQPSYVFSTYLTIGSEGEDVRQLQKILADQGYFSDSQTGYYGPVTYEAVKKFQTAKGINTLGVVGPSTRDALNAIQGTSVVPTREEQIQAILKAILQLQAQLAALQQT